MLMTESLAPWLRLREPADASARSEALARAVGATLDCQRPVNLVDLATGTGSNIRYLAERLPCRRQRWLAIDREARLLEELLNRMAEWTGARGYRIERTGTGCAILGEALECHVETRQIDLGSLDHERLFKGRHIVTASALLDLVSARWLRALAHHTQAAGAAALFAITYDGRSSCSPREPEDDIVRDLMNRHQKTDKGLGGPAEGPDAVTCAERVFEQVGFRVRRERSDWSLGANDAELQRELVEGWARASIAIAPALSPTIADWRCRRLAHIDSGNSQLVVGHYDLAAVIQR
jgi:hypothetical protein